MGLRHTGALYCMYVVELIPENLGAFSQLHQIRPISSKFIATGSPTFIPGEMMVTYGLVSEKPTGCL